MRYVLPLVVLLLSACAIDRSGMMESRHGATCRGLGLEKGTPAYADCLIKLYRRP
jgi:hypothetical protein